MLFRRVAKLAATALRAQTFDTVSINRTVRGEAITNGRYVHFRRVARKLRRRPSGEHDYRSPQSVNVGYEIDPAIGRAATSSSSVCIFCMRNEKNLNTVIDSNKTFYVRLDNFPATPGHVEVVPKRHVESFFDLSDSEILDAYALIRIIEKKISVQYGPAGYTIGINEGRVAGRSIDHLHIHLIPRHEGDVPDPRGGIRQVLPNCEPDSWTQTAKS